MWFSVALLCAGFFLGARSDSGHDFSYEDESQWGSICVNGKRQSPINIPPVASHQRESVLGLQLYGFYNQEYPAEITNLGHTVQVNLAKTPRFVEFEGKRYQLEQLHFHWALDSKKGTEHRINGRQYALEAHFVSWNLKYGSFSNAGRHSDGVLVIGVLFEETNARTPGLEVLAKMVEAVRRPGQKFVSPKPLALLDLMPFNLPQPTFSTYEGSLTTPPCSEVVTWIVFDTIVPINSQLLKSFQKTEMAERGNFVVVANNARSAQSLNGRRVRSARSYTYKFQEFMKYPSLIAEPRTLTVRV